jgi:hypothetical protein
VIAALALKRGNRWISPPIVSGTSAPCPLHARCVSATVSGLP